MRRRWVLVGLLALAGCAGAPSHHALVAPSTSKAAVATPSPTVPATAAPPCRRAELRAVYRGGGLTTGLDVGTLVVWNAGPRACLLRGSALFSALWADGTVDRAAGNDRAVVVDAVLQPRTPSPTAGADLSQGSYVQAILAAPERDDPHQPDGMCRPRDELTPARLRLRIDAVVLEVPNKDPHPMQAPSIWGCHGTVTLEQVQEPGA